MFFLYESVLGSVFTDWIDVVDLCCLDSAICCKQFRCKFLSILSKCSIVNATITTIDDDYKLWLQLRGLKLKTLYLDVSTPVPLGVLHPNHLSYVETCDCSRLAQIVTSDMVIDKLKLALKSMTPEVLQFGHLVTHIEIDEECSVNSLSTVFPNLKWCRCTSYNEHRDYFLELIDVCELRVIENCNLLFLLYRKACPLNFLSDLHRVSGMDDTTVCLGQNKYYKVTSLRCIEGVNIDVESIAPLLPNLVDLYVYENAELVRVVAQKCKCLTKLHISPVSAMERDVLAVIKASVCLKELLLSNEIRLVPYSGNELLHAVSSYCPCLQKCRLENIAVNAEATSLLFERCTDLIMFEGRFWPCLSLLIYARHISSLSVYSHTGLGYVMKKGRLRNQLVMSYHYASDLILNLVKQNCLSQVKLHELTLGCETFNGIINACTGLKHLSVIKCVLNGNHWTGSCWTSVINNSTLITLELVNVRGLYGSILSQMFQNKQCLRNVKLSLSDCWYRDPFLELVATTCSDLRILSISNNDVITSAGVIAVLRKCKLLEMLELVRCPKVTHIILFSIQSPPLRKLKLIDCDAISDKIGVLDELLETLEIDIGNSKLK